MALDVAGFRELMPGAFDDASDDEIVASIDEARNIHDQLEEATLYCAAHLLSLRSEWQDEPDGGAGVVTSETIGPRTIDYKTTAGESERRAFYATTPFGRRFMALEDRNARSQIGAIVV